MSARDKDIYIQGTGELMSSHTRIRFYKYGEKELHKDYISGALHISIHDAVAGSAKFICLTKEQQAEMVSFIMDLDE